MNQVFYYLMDLILITRLFYHFRDRPINLSQSIKKSVIEVAGLLVFPFSIWIIILGISLIFLNLLIYFLEKNEIQLNLKRLIALTIYILFSSIISAPYFNIHFNEFLIKNLSGLSNYEIIIIEFSGLNWQFFLTVLFGFLISLNEVNIFIRHFFEVLDLVPKKGNKEKSSDIDIKEYNRGRVIGFLERILIFYFVFNGFYSALGFILAAKGLTRFKDLEERTFAEYFLIGTLLSTVIAGALALLVKQLLNI